MAVRPASVPGTGSHAPEHEAKVAAELGRQVAEVALEACLRWRQAGGRGGRHMRREPPPPRTSNRPKKTMKAERTTEVKVMETREVTKMRMATRIMASALHMLASRNTRSMPLVDHLDTGVYLRCFLPPAAAAPAPAPASTSPPASAPPPPAGSPKCGGPDGGTGAPPSPPNICAAVAIGSMRMHAAAALSTAAEAPTQQTCAVAPGRTAGKS